MHPRDKLNLIGISIWLYLIYTNQGIPGLIGFAQDMLAMLKLTAMASWLVIDLNKEELIIRAILVIVPCVILFLRGQLKRRYR